MKIETAIHESCHAIVGLAIGLRLGAVEIGWKFEPEDGGLSAGRCSWPEQIRSNADTRAMAAAGLIGERLLVGDRGFGCFKSDQKRIIESVRDDLLELGAQHLRIETYFALALTCAMTRAARIIIDNEQAVLAVAAELLKKKNLTGDEVLEIMKAEGPEGCET